MNKINRQAGFAQLLLILVLLGGLAFGVYLVGQRTNLFSRASSSNPVKPPICKPVVINLLRFSTPCDGIGFRRAEVECDDQFNKKEGTALSACKTPAQWEAELKSVCNARSVCSSPTTAISPTRAVTPTTAPTVAPTSVPTTAPTATKAPSPTPTGSAKRVFVTSTSYDGNLGGLSGADAKCQERARLTGWGGTWKAWLSDSTTSAASRLNPNAGPYYNTKNLSNYYASDKVADNLADLTDGTLDNSIDLTENMTLTNRHLVFTGSRVDGTAHPPTFVGRFNGVDLYHNYHCNNWTFNSQTGGNYIGGGTGISGYSDNKWTNDFFNSRCYAKYRLYCFEQ